MDEIPSSRAVLATCIAIVVGIAVWIVIEWTTGVEAWDHDAYWLAGYPLMILAAGLLGFWVPQGFLWWPVALVLGQATWAILSAFEQAIVLPFSLIVFFVLGLPCLLASYIGARFARKRQITSGTNPRYGK